MFNSDRATQILSYRPHHVRAITSHLCRLPCNPYNASPMACMCGSTGESATFPARSSSAAPDGSTICRCSPYIRLRAQLRGRRGLFRRERFQQCARGLPLHSARGTNMPRVKHQLRRANLIHARVRRNVNERAVAAAAGRTMPRRRSTRPASPATRTLSPRVPAHSASGRAVTLPSQHLQCVRNGLQALGARFRALGAPLSTLEAQFST